MLSGALYSGLPLTSVGGTTSLDGMEMMERAGNDEEKRTGWYKGKMADEGSGKLGGKDWFKAYCPSFL